MKNDQRSLIHFLLASTRRITAAGIIVFIWLLIPPGISSQTKSLVIAVEDDAAPWSRADGTGYVNDVVTAAFKAVGVNVELSVMPYARCKRKAVRGDIAGCFSMSPSPEFKGVIELSAKPLFTYYAGYFCNMSQAPRVAGQENIAAGTVVGTVIGYEYPATFEALRQKGVVVLEESPSEDINLKKLALGRVDMALLTFNDMKSPEWLIARAGVGNKVKVLFRSGVLNSYIGFSLKHPQGPWALQQFNKGYRLIVANGILQRVRKTWLEKLEHEKPSTRR